MIKSKPKTSFMIRNSIKGGFDQVQGKEIILSGDIKAFSFKSENDNWRVGHQETGLLLHTRFMGSKDPCECWAFGTRKEAIQDAEANIARYGDKLKGYINRAITKYGFNVANSDQINLF